MYYTYVRMYITYLHTQVVVGGAFFFLLLHNHFITEEKFKEKSGKVKDSVSMWKNFTWKKCRNIGGKLKKKIYFSISSWEFLSHVKRWKNKIPMWRDGKITNKNLVQGRYKRGPLSFPSHDVTKHIFCKFPMWLHGEDGMGWLVRTYYVCNFTYIHAYTHTNTHKHTGSQVAARMVA